MGLVFGVLRFIAGGRKGRPDRRLGRGVLVFHRTHVGGLSGVVVIEVRQALAGVMSRCAGGEPEATIRGPLEMR